MGHLFSKKKVSKVNEQDKAVLQLKTTRDKIRQHQKRSEQTIEKDRLLAKKLLQMDKKERAKLLLRKKKFIEEKLAQADIQLENVEGMIQSIEYAQVEMKVADSLKTGNEALKLINELMDIEDIETMLDETKEAVEKQEEINALLSGSSETVDESELENEFAELLKDILATQIPSPPQEEEESEPIVLPDVPEGELEDKEKRKVPRKAVAMEAS